MKVIINGKEEHLNHEKLSVVDLLKERKVEMPDMVSVQLNGGMLKRDEFESVHVKENDRIEFLYFMGGG
jgi:sulfur carrier protein